MENKKIWITGASSGIGKALAIDYSKRNTVLILSSIDSDGLEEVKKICESNGSESHAYPFDLGDEVQLRKVANEVLQKFEYVDVLINNGGISQRAYAFETDFSVDRKIMEVNFFSAVLLTKMVLPKMIERKKGNIVALSSINGKFGFFLRSAYSASKHAIFGFFETLHMELKDKGINVTVVVPGRINTNISSHALKKDGKEYNKRDKAQAEGMSAEKCAKIIVKAIEKNKKEILVGKNEILMVHVKRLFPRIFNRIITKIKH
ncbi:MAG: SDR family oxidoreductase [Verrucomicrobiota bacterium]|nr:SDR family oxidoreductase [Verrucomicrobiota bacterium]